MDAGQDEVNAREKLRAVVMPREMHCDFTQKWIFCGIELRPSCGNGRKEGGAIQTARYSARVGCILRGSAEDVVHER